MPDAGRQPVQVAITGGSAELQHKTLEELPVHIATTGGSAVGETLEEVTLQLTTS